MKKKTKKYKKLTKKEKEEIEMKIAKLQRKLDIDDENPLDFLDGEWKGE